MTQPRLLGGRYQLEGVIGRGGMAEVYRARDQRLDRIVAVKTLRSDLARDATFQARFRREAQSAASLNHPSVIAVYDTGEDQFGDTTVPYIVMEYVEGNTLRELIREDRRLVPERAMEIVDGILRALDYSHRGGIVHRDIKPANVMLTRNHEVKVMDFGIARAMADSAATMTQTAQVIGTAQYLSPEQARGERVDARSDLYSTGCVLYELLTGRPPFTGDSPVAIAYQHVREEPIPPSQVAPEIPHWCDNIVLKAMAKDPNHRYQSATEFRADIQRAMQGMPVSATASSTMVMGGAPPQGTQVMGPVGSRTQMHQPAGTDYGLPPVSYDEPERRGGAGKKAAIWALVVVLIIGGAAAIGVMMAGDSGSGGGGNKNEVAVPAALVNTKVAEAKKAITDAGLTVGEVKPEFSDDVDKNMVISTDPESGTSVARGSKVNLVVSRGKKPAETVTIPEGLEGGSAAKVKSQLQELGLTVSTQKEASDSVEKNKVIRTDPEGGTKVPKNSQVTVVVSSGSNQITVPSVVSLTEADARRQLQQAGLKVQVRYTPDPAGDNTPGTVVGQSIPANQQVQRGTTVIITVYKPDDQGDPNDPSPDPSNPSGNGG